jgi:hypothetical protein
MVYCAATGSQYQEYMKLCLLAAAAGEAAAEVGSQFIRGGLGLISSLV